MDLGGARGNVLGHFVNLFVAIDGKGCGNAERYYHEGRDVVCINNFSVCFGDFFVHMQGYNLLILSL